MVWVSMAKGLILLNLALLFVLGTIWGRNFWRFRSKHTFGLLLFASLLWIENAIALYYYSIEPVVRVWVTQIPPVAQRWMMLFRLFEAVALAVLTWTSWD